MMHEEMMVSLSDVEMRCRMKKCNEKCARRGHVRRTKGRGWKERKMRKRNEGK